MSLQSLAKYDAQGTLVGLISQIMTGDEITRDRCLKFLAYKFISFGPDVITKQIEENMINEIKKILQVKFFFLNSFAKCLSFARLE